MVADRISIHDQFTVEFQLTYENIFKDKRTPYDTITYLFVPSGLNINPQTYTLSKFYNDVKVYIRYHASIYDLNDLLNLKSGPFKQLKKSVQEVIQNPQDKKRLELYESRIKLLGAILNYTLRSESERIIALAKSDISIIKVEYLETLKEILKSYRNLKQQIEKSAVDSFTTHIIRYGDEYLSTITSYHLIELVEYYKKLKVKKDALKDILQCIKEEQNYRKSQEYDSEPVNDHLDETLLYNRSQLKKYIESVLFLNRDVRKDGTFVEQSVFAISAGLAMVFSTSIAFYYQQMYGNFTMPFFIALVVSYMLKDRIKWLTGLLFIQKASSFFYDYDIKIKDPHHNVIGKIKENFIFVPLEKLGAKVKQHRFKGRFLEYDAELNGEQIIQYKKKIVIYPKKFGKEISDNRLNSLLDITRFNLQRFATQMDDPIKEYSLLKKGKIMTRTGNKNYHINIIQKIYTEKGIEFKRYRVVMNKLGIKRIEPVELDDLV
jgi:hypothetical protein